MQWLNVLKKPSSIILIVVLITSVLLSFLAYRTVVGSRASTMATPVAAAPSTPTSTPTSTTTATPSLTTLPVQDPSQVLGIDGNPSISYTGIPWIRLGYPSCGGGDQRGEKLRNTIQSYHSHGIRVMLTVCQGPNNNDAALFDPKPLNDAAQGNADAVQCGNEEMKQDANVSFLYIPPEKFAKFYDLCDHAFHAVRHDIPVVLGSLDPHVGGVDYQPLEDQAGYLNQMQDAMDTSVHPGGNWDWHNQTLGLINSWHDGYPNASVNSLQGLFSFWAQQFHVDLNSGQLGKHLWVVEGTGCFKGCGVDPNNSYQVALSHILALTTDVQTSLQDKVPFFYFSGKDFTDQGFYWPIGVIDANNHPKPIRQDLPMGARTLTLSCPGGGNTTIKDQLQLLAKLYARCTLPGNYVSSITS